MQNGTFITETTAWNPAKNRIRATRTAEGECQKRYRRWETINMEDRGGWIRLHFRCTCPIPGYEDMAE